MKAMIDMRSCDALLRFTGKILLMLLVVGSLSFVSGCTLSGSGEREESVFQNIERVTFQFDPVSDGSERIRLDGFTPQGADSLIVRDSLRIRPGARYAVSLQADSPDIQAYLSTSGPPATLFYKTTSSLNAVLSVGPISVSVQRFPNSATEEAQFGRSVKHHARFASMQATSQSSGPVDILRFEITTADTSATGSLRLRLERYRDEGANEPDHVDFDVDIPVRIVKQ